MNVIVTRAAEGLARRSFTVAEIRRMVEAGIIAEDENFELIDGELVPMSPKGNQHEVIKAALTAVFVTGITKELRVAQRRRSIWTNAPSSNPTFASIRSGSCRRMCRAAT